LQAAAACAELHARQRQHATAYTQQVTLQRDDGTHYLLEKFRSQNNDGVQLLHMLLCSVQLLTVMTARSIRKI